MIKEKTAFSFQSRLAIKFVRKNVGLVFIGWIIGILLALVIEDISIQELYSLVYIKMLLILLAIPLFLQFIIAFEQIYYSYNRKLIINGDSFTYFIGKEQVLEFSRDQISQLIVVENIVGTRFPILGAKFGILRLFDNHEIIIPGFMGDNLIGISLDKSVGKKMLLPSIFLYEAFLSNEY